jgi:predicted metalloprotease
MRFNPKARIDQSQIENRTGGASDGGGFSGGIPGIPGGGGSHLGIGGTIIVVILGLIFGFNPFSSSGTGTDSSTVTSDNCSTGADANATDSCAIDLVTNSVQDYWRTAYPAQTGKEYTVIKTVKFETTTSSACGTANSDMGPFYCPNDQVVYLDSTFFKTMLQGQLHAKGGPFTIGYVVAHEYGHHIEDELGILGQIKTAQGPASDSVRVELMADCLAGQWAKFATTTKDAEGNAIISDLTQDDIARAIDSARAVGDDTIEKENGGQVNPESFTHGTSAQRIKWFNIGLDKGTIKACNTFNVDSL